MAQKRTSDQSKCAAVKLLLKKLEDQTARDVKGRLDDNWRDIGGAQHRHSQNHDNEHERNGAA